MVTMGKVLTISNLTSRMFTLVGGNFTGETVGSFIGGVFWEGHNGDCKGEGEVVTGEVIVMAEGIGVVFK